MTYACAEPGVSWLIGDGCGLPRFDWSRALQQRMTEGLVERERKKERNSS
jgi:hypothetical protein